MYYPVGWHKVLKLDIARDNIISVQANHDRELFLILTNRSLHIWHPRPAAEIVRHVRSDESIESLGHNCFAVWKTNSTKIVVATEKDQLLFFKVRRRFSPDSVYKLKCNSKSEEDVVREHSCHKELANKIYHDTVPALTTFACGKLDLSSVGVSCLMSAKEELIIGSRNGEIYGVYWKGEFDENFPWSLSRDVTRGTDYVIVLKFSSVLAGFVAIFQSGKVGFMSTKSDSSKDIEDPPTQKQPGRLNYLKTADRAISADINHRYRLVSIGLMNGEIIVCNINDLNQNLVVNHKLKLQDNKFPLDVTKLGPVRCLRYSPDGVALVSSWDCGDFAIWSVFGSLLFCTQQWQVEARADNSFKMHKITSMSWSQEGYNLWISVVREGNDSAESEESRSTLNGHSQASLDISDDLSAALSLSDSASGEEVVIISIAHSNLPASPHLTCSSDCILLMSEDRLHIGPSVPHRAEFDSWFVVDLPQQYLNSNFPIRYASVDRQCKNVAIAGNRGLALYSIEETKWKFFSKSHESCFSVCGDLIWWNNYIIASGYSLESRCFELRAFPTSEPLDNAHSIQQKLTMEIIRMSIFENRLLVLYSDGTLGMFMLNLKYRPNYRKTTLPGSATPETNNLNGITTNGDTSQQFTPRSTRSDSILSFKYPLGKSQDQIQKGVVLQISPIENLAISNLQANACCISSIALTRLHFKNSRTDDSILLNACGKLFLLEREVPSSLSSPSPDMPVEELRDSSLGSNKSSEIELKVKEAKRLSNSVHLVSASLRSTIDDSSALANITFKAVSVIATNVEQFWISPEISNASEMSYFKKSLWLSCGGINNHLQVWLPLLNDKRDSPSDLYVPDRIMLPIKCDIYPLAIRSSTPSDLEEPDDAIVLGAENDVLFSDNKLFTYFPYSAIKRQCRVYLHRILRELLLKQHLGYYARKIAESCQSLPYFAHCFELLLHEVLEEEATSPVPLPDPMLPQIVRFIKEFPVYLETVVHCARKSELSMWSHLFDERAVGSPRRLFQECLERNKLDTAASCLIILHSLDRNIVSQRMVRQLIQLAKDSEKFHYLIEELENFLARAELDYAAVSGSGSPES